MDELQASPWAIYFSDTYGELPAAGYPICVFDFWVLRNGTSTSLQKLGLTAIAQKAGGGPHGWQIPSSIRPILSQFYPGLAYRYAKGEYVNGDLYLGTLMNGYTIYRDWYFYHQLPDHAWVEVVHNAGSTFNHETEAMWFSRARGSGVWFDVGKTIAFDTHTEAFNEYLIESSGPCQKVVPIKNSTDPLAEGAVFENALSVCMRSKGYDSFQFRPDPYPVMQTFGMAGWSELASTKTAGHFTCGVESGGTANIFRTGWRATRPCDCDASQYLTNCRIENASWHNHEEHDSPQRPLIV